MKEKFNEIYAGTIRSVGYARQGFAGVGIGSGVFLHLSFQETMLIGMVFLPAWLGDVSFMHISGCFPEM